MCNLDTCNHVQSWSFFLEVAHLVLEMGNNWGLRNAFRNVLRIGPEILRCDFRGVDAAFVLVAPAVTELAVNEVGDLELNACVVVAVPFCFLRMVQVGERLHI